MLTEIDKEIVKLLENEPELRKLDDEINEKWENEILMGICTLESMKEKLDWLQFLIELAKL